MMKSSRKTLMGTLAATAVLIQLLSAPAMAEDSIELLTGSIRATRLVPPDAAAPAETDAAAALEQAMPPVPAEVKPASVLSAAPAAPATVPAAPAAQPAAAAVSPAPAAPVAASAARSGPDEVELAALYYYAGQKQDARVNAETERLRIKYPDFQVPGDLYAAKDIRRVDEQPLWALYEKDDFQGVDALVEKLKALNPGWLPSEDFAAKLARRKLRVTLTHAYKGKDWVGVISAAGGINLQKEKDADLLWMLIDAYREAAMPDALLDVYKAILFRPQADRLPEAVLVTTLQKATRDFQPEEVRGAMAAIWPNPQLIVALKPLQDDFIRRDIADFNGRSERQDPLAERDIQRLRDLVAAKGDTADMSLLGWYFLKLKQPKEAEPYFSRALEEKPTPEFAKGLYLSLAQQKRDEEAYALAAAHLKELLDDPQFLMNALSLRFAKPELGVIDPKTVEAYTNTILQTKSADHAEILAWYAYNSMQFAASEAWFVQAWNWEEEPNRLKGVALSFLREGKKKQFAALRARFGDLYPDMWAEILNTRAPARQALQPVVVTSPTTGAPVIVYRQADVAAAAPPVQAVAYQPQPAALPVVQPEASYAQPAVSYAQPAVSYAQPQIVYASAPAALPQEDHAEPEPQVRQVKVSKGPRSGYFASFKAKKYSQCIDQLNAMGALPADAELIRGWCYLGLNRVTDAKAAFERALSGRGQVRHDAAYGSALASLRAKLTDDAEAIITAYPLDAGKDHEVRAEIYWQRARSAFDHKDFEGTLAALNARLKLTPEPSDLSMLRAWAHFKLGHKQEARAIFVKLNSQLADPEAMKGLAALEEDHK